MYTLIKDIYSFYVFIYLLYAYMYTFIKSLYTVYVHK